MLGNRIGFPRVLARDIPCQLFVLCGWRHIGGRRRLLFCRLGRIRKFAGEIAIEAHQVIDILGRNKLTGGLHGRLDILPLDPAARPGPGQGFEVDIVLLGQLDS